MVTTNNDFEDWGEILKDHPIFSLPQSLATSTPEERASLELSTATLPKYINVDPEVDSPTPSGRRQVMILKDAELLVAAGKELRITSLGDAKLSRNSKKTYKTLHTPNVQFEIHQIVLNPSGKLLAVAGAFQVAVIVMPRAGSTRLIPQTIDCKTVAVGQFYHASATATPIAKIDWHPWGDAGSTLLVMTIDGKLREYDISMDNEEPTQVLSFVPERRTKSYVAEDSSEREVASFSLGKGRADWGPLTVYVVMKSGDVYAICPYMPKNASIPSSYVHSLECFISAKQEFLSKDSSAASKDFSTLYDYQRKYVTALLKQLPPGTVFPATSRSVPMHPPTTIKASPARQGPFLLQPSPRLLEGSEGGDATDIAYLTFGVDEDPNDADGAQTEHLGVVLLAYQDGKVDLCLDVEKVEARWETKHLPQNELPMLAVYESIDLGILKNLNTVSSTKAEPPITDLLQGNHPVFIPDPIYDDTIYLYHAFGVHLLHLGPVLQNLADALRAEDNSAALDSALKTSATTTVRPILSTFSVERRCSNPIIGLAVPNDVYLTYSIFVLSSAMRITSLPLTLRSEAAPEPPVEPPALEHASSPEVESPWTKPVEGPTAYVSLLGEPFKVPECLSRTPGLPRLSLPQGAPNMKTEIVLTPDVLRFLATVIAQLTSQIHDVQLAYKNAVNRTSLQQEEATRLATKSKEVIELLERLQGPWKLEIEDKMRRVQAEQKRLLGRLDRQLQALMQRASPELSEHETKWFEELRRMKEEVMGVSKYDEGSLAARTKALERDYQRILPSLKALRDKEKLRTSKTTDLNRSLGFSQAFELGKRSHAERAKINDVQSEILKLAQKLEVALPRLPSSRE
ncbi:hypothetical protein AX16_000066 [Volvariella volvacea WC 439]|nr:hypothetical protein AX16_000066 [Volvariella volvacea WC 439]